MRFNLTSKQKGRPDIFCGYGHLTTIETSAEDCKQRNGISFNSGSSDPSEVLWDAEIEYIIENEICFIGYTQLECSLLIPTKWSLSQHNN